MKKTLVAAMAATLIFGSHAMAAKVTYDDALASSSGFYEANNAVNISPSKNGLGPEETPSVPTDNGWVLKVFTVVTKGGCCGTEARTLYGKFDAKTGDFLGYVDSEYTQNTGASPDW